MHSRNIERVVSKDRPIGLSDIEQERGLTITPADGLQPPLTSIVEPVEKVNFDRIWSDGRKSDFSECSVFDDLMLARGQETPENHPLIAVRGFFYRLVRWQGTDGSDE